MQSPTRRTGRSARPFESRDARAASSSRGGCGGGPGPQAQERRVAAGHSRSRRAAKRSSPSPAPPGRMKTGRPCLRAGARAPRAAGRPARAARPAGVGDSSRSTADSSVPSASGGRPAARRRRANRRRARRSRRRPRRGRARGRARRRARRAASCSFAGSRNGVSRSGRARAGLGEGRRSTLPDAVRGSASRKTKDDGIIDAGRRRASARRSSPTPGLPRRIANDPRREPDALGTLPPLDGRLAHSRAATAGPLPPLAFRRGARAPSGARPCGPDEQQAAVREHPAEVARPIEPHVRPSRDRRETSPPSARGPSSSRRRVSRR